MGEEAPQTISKGDVTLRIADIVRDPRGVERMVADIVRTEWPVSRLRRGTIFLTPFPKPVDLYEWDSLLLRRYEPLYAPQTTVCYDCALGPCDLSGGKIGGCGGDIRYQQARGNLLMACMGASSSISYARQLYDYAVSEFSEHHPLSVEGKIGCLQTRVITGLPSPEKLGELEQVLRYLEGQLTSLLSSTIPGTQTNHVELESMALHAGTLTHLAQEVSETIKVSCFNFFTTRSLSDEELKKALELKTVVGVGSVDTSKPVIMFVGQNLLPAVELVNLVKDQKLENRVEVCGVGPVAQELLRILDTAKIVGPATRLLLYLRLGLADVVLADNICVKIELLSEAERTRTPVIATTEAFRYGLPDRTDDPAYQIVEDLVEGNQRGALISDPVKAAEVALRVSIELKGGREERRRVDFGETSEKCKQSDMCSDLCPFQLPIAEAVRSADIQKLRRIYDDCTFCGSCEQKSGLPLVDLIIQASEDRIRKESFSIRGPRGPIGHRGLRELKSSIDSGKVPGVIALLGCGKYPSSARELVWMVNELTTQNYVVLVSGCSAIEMAMSGNNEGKNPYQVNHALLRAGGLVNMGGCTTSTNVSSVYLEFACLGGEIPTRANFMELADYTLNTTNGAVIAWGVCEELVYPIIEGYARMGIPVVIGPRESRLGGYLMSNIDNKENLRAVDRFTGERIWVEPAPEHLIVHVETKEEAVATAAKLCIRPNDSREGRASRIDSYTRLVEKHFNKLPEDVNYFIREEGDLPPTRKSRIIELLKERHGWEAEGERIIRAVHPVTGEQLVFQEFVSRYGVKRGGNATLLRRLAAEKR